jgi:protein ImuA
MHADALERLRAEIAQIEGVGAKHPTLPFGVDAIDRVLGGGLATGALHEIAGGRELADDAAATTFLAGILARLEGPVFWCLRWRDLFAPALDLVGLDPDRVIFVEAGSDTTVLTAMEECLRHSGLGGVVGEVAKCSLTASRRLQLAAEKSGVSAFVFRRASPSDLSPGTAAVTRWRVEAIPTQSLGMPALGRPRWRLALERVRGGEPQFWTVESCDAQGCIALSADLADRSAAAEIRHAA